jgi:galactose oxidase
LNTGSCLIANESIRTRQLFQTSCPRLPDLKGTRVQWKVRRNNDTARTWTFVNVFTGGSLDFSGTTLLWNNDTGSASQKWRFYSISSPPGRLAKFSAPIALPIIGIAATNLPDGSILMWSSSQIDNFGTGQLRTFAVIYNPLTGAVSQQVVTSLKADMFCPGIALLTDGTVVVVGGVTSGVTSIFNATTGAWGKGPNLNTPRGYNSATTLSDGGVFTLGGSWSGGYGNKGGEVWRPPNKWVRLSRVKIDPFLTEDNAGMYRQDNQMFHFAGSNGYVFHAGPSRAMYWISTAGNGSTIWAGNRSDDGHAMNGNAVLFDVGKILATGGAPNYSGGLCTRNAYVIDISAGPEGNVTVERTGRMLVARSLHNSVVLPSGEVVVVGGQTDRTTLFHDRNAAMTAEIWSPVTGRFEYLAWGSGATPLITPRTYHAVALLLPDGRVLASGGGACGTLCAYNHYDAQIITPPYLLAPNGAPAARPSLLAAPAKARVGEAVTVSAAGAATFALVRLGSATHAVNTDQRRVPLAATLQSDLPASPTEAAAYSLAIPGDPGVVVPGVYMLFALGPTGTPSVALHIKIYL